MFHVKHFGKIGARAKTLDFWSKMDDLHSFEEPFPAMSEMSLEAPAPAPYAPAKAFTQASVRRLALADFRSYASLDLAVNGRLVVLTGDNGAGKTNLLEALSLLAPGRGLRRAELRDCVRSNGGGGFAISVELETQNGGVQLGTGIEPQTDAPPLRKYRIDREPVGSIRGFSDHVRVVWLTPAMDGLFIGPAGDRRRFLDRLVLAIDADHGTRVASLERCVTQPQPFAGGGPRRRPRLARRDRTGSRRTRHRGCGRAVRDHIAAFGAHYGDAG